jgi:hypothetical protein
MERVKNLRIRCHRRSGSKSAVFSCSAGVDRRVTTRHRLNLPASFAFSDWHRLFEGCQRPSQKKERANDLYWRNGFRRLEATSQGQETRIHTKTVTPSVHRSGFCPSFSSDHNEMSSWRFNLSGINQAMELNSMDIRQRRLEGKTNRLKRRLD